MGSFYGGREGHSFIIVRNFTSVKEMVENFKLGPSYNEVHFDEYVLINTPNKANPENGQIFKRGYDYDGVRKIKTYNPEVKNGNLVGKFIIEEIESGGAIYIGTIAGPAGRAPIFNFTTMNEVLAKENVAHLHINSLNNDSKPGSLEEVKEYLDKKFSNGEVPVDSNGNVILDGSNPKNKYNYVEFTMYDGGNQEIKYYFYYDKISYSDAEDSIKWYLIDAPVVVPTGSYTVNNKHLIPGVTYNSGYSIDSDGKKHKIPKGYQDSLDWAYCSIRNENNEDTTAYVGFKIPYTIFEYEAESVDAYYNRSDTITIANPTDAQKTKTFNHLNLAEEVNTGHPFYCKWNFKIPKGIKGESIKNLKVVTANENMNVVAFDTDKNGNLQYNTNGSIKTKAYEGRDDDVSNSRKIIVYDYYCYDRIPEGEHHTIYLGDFNKIDNINFSNNGTITIDYSHDNTKTYSKLIDWITDMSFADDGTVTVSFNNDTLYSGKLTKDKLFTWMTDFTLNEETGAINVTFNNDKIAKISTALQWVKDITLGSDGTLTTNYTNIEDRVESKKLNWIKSCTFNSDTGAFSMTFNNSNISNISKTLNYIKKVELDANNHLIITHSDPSKGAQDLGGIGQIMVASTGDSDLTSKQNKLNTGGVWLITKEV